MIGEPELGRKCLLWVVMLGRTQQEENKPDNKKFRGKNLSDKGNDKLNLWGKKVAFLEQVPKKQTRGSRTRFSNSGEQWRPLNYILEAMTIYRL